MPKKHKTATNSPATLSAKRAKDLVRDAILEMDRGVLDGISGLAINAITSSVVKHLTDAGMVSPESDDELLEGFEAVTDPKLRQDLLDAFRTEGRDKVVADMIRAIGNVNKDSSSS